MKQTQRSMISVITLTTSMIILVVHGQDLNVADFDLKLSRSASLALEKFRAGVLPILPHNYMKEDSYIIKFLRAKNFNTNAAERFLKQNLKWRKEYGMDRIHNESFSDILKEYPEYVDAIDKSGAPVITANAGTYNLRRAVVNGFNKRLLRMLYKLVDEACVKVRKAQLQGKRVTRFQFLLNLQGFNLITHGCPRCMLDIVDFLQHLDTYFHGMEDKIVFINAPPAFQVIRPTVQDALSEGNRARMKIFGVNKAEWRRYLLNFINADQLTPEFGGTRIRS